MRVSCIDLDNPKINLDIQNGEKFKIVKLVEDIVNAQKEDFSKVKTVDNTNSSFDTSIIKIVIPAFTLKDYQLEFILKV